MNDNKTMSDKIDIMFFAQCRDIINKIKDEAVDEVIFGDYVYYATSKELGKYDFYGINNRKAQNCFMVRLKEDGEFEKSENLTAADELDFLEYYIDNNCESIIIDKANKVRDKYERILSKTKGK